MYSLVFTSSYLLMSIKLSRISAFCAYPNQEMYRFIQNLLCLFLININIIPRKGLLIRVYPAFILGWSHMKHQFLNLSPFSRMHCVRTHMCFASCRMFERILCTACCLCICYSVGVTQWCLGPFKCILLILLLLLVSSTIFKPVNSVHIHTLSLVFSASHSHTGTKSYLPLNDTSHQQHKPTNDGPD